jgi:leucyl/phenylalanyl-tRNA--protein transferase
MFYRVSNASKVALAHLVQRLRERRFSLFDVQMVTPLTQQLGAIEIPRQEYLSRLAAAVQKTPSFS